jgi:adenosylhomocysteine nucleosidase
MLGDKKIAVAVSKPGQIAAAKATEAILLGHRPRWLLSAGLAGSLRADVHAGDLLLPQSVRNETGETLDFASLPDISTLKAGAMPASPRVGQLLSVDRPILSSEEKRRLGETTGCLAVEMETFSVAKVCRQANIPIYSARVISDAVDRDLPPEIRHLIGQKSRAGQWGAVLGTIWRRPTAVQDFWRLFQESSQAAETLATFIGQIAPCLP